MAAERPRNLTEKHIYTQVAGSERSGESEGGSSGSDKSSDVEAGPGFAAGAEARDAGGAGRESSSSASQTTSETERSSSSRATSSRDTSEQPSSSQGASSRASLAAEAPEEATDTTPLLQGEEARTDAGLLGGGGTPTSARAKAAAKAKAKSIRKPAGRAQQVRAWCSWRTVAACAVFAAVPAVVAAVYLQWCALSDWGMWGECLPPAPGAANCGRGVRNRTRAVVRGNCGGRSLIQTEPCDLGECREPDYLAEAAELPCNARSRGQLLQEAEAAFGAVEWAALRRCDRAYLCCHACKDTYLAAGPLTCGDNQVPPRPLFAAGRCLSCFAAGPGPGCRGGKAFCQRTFTSAAGGGTAQLCCLAVGPRRAQRHHTASQREPPPDDENFDRRPNANAVLGLLRDPRAWPSVANEAACQQRCWQDPECSLYVYVSPSAGIRRWHGRCVTWGEETAEEQGRASAASWIPERGVFSGRKAHVSYSDVVVTVQTAEGPGTGSDGPFDVFICRSLAHCQLQSPIRLSARSCTAGAQCLSPGTTAHFVGTVVVPEAFELHAVRIEGHTADAWVFDSLSVACETQLGSHHGRVSLGTGSWTTAMGCVTTAGWRVTAQPGTPCASACHSGYGPYGWCWADEEHATWGNCAEACLRSGEKPRGGEAMSRSAVSCAELNWPTWSQYNQDHSVCGASNDWPLHGCSGPLDWDAAKEFCELIGARLCTRSEVEADEAAGTGCDLDRQHIWSATPCEHGYMALPGASRYLDTVEARCTPPASTSAQARCCADARKIEVVFLRSHRNAHVLPWHMRRGRSTGLAEWQVVAGEDHAGRQGFFLQSGMLDDQAPGDSQSVDVLLEEVPVSKLGGEIEFYFQTDTEPGRDQLHFFIDGVEESRGGFPVSGRVGWTLARFSFPARKDSDLHTFLWRYSKDRSDSVGKDVACIDKITVFDVLGQE